MLRTALAGTTTFVVLAGSLTGLAQSPRTHRLAATPTTVAYGYYWPKLQAGIADRIRRHHRCRHAADQLADGPGTAGVPPEQIQDSLKAIVGEVTGDRRGPGGHILTGPVYVEGAEPGDALENKILSIDFAIDYGYNGCNGFIPANCDRAVRKKS